MILEETLKNLHVSVRGGGNLVSHRPIFSNDSRNLFVIASDSIHIFNTESGHCSAQIQVPSVSPIANIVITTGSNTIIPPIESELVILTESGELFHVSLENYEFTSVENINQSLEKGWTSIRRWLNVLEVRPGVFLFVGHPENEEEILVYEANINLESKQRRYCLEKICWRILPSTHSVAVGCGGDLVAAVQADSVFMTNTISKVSKWHKSGSRNFSCVAAHPHEWIVATGDDSGRILLWKNFLEDKSPPKTVFHWHTLPVADLCFTTDGTKLLSGGGECCLVRWDTADPTDRKILPRMGLPIRHLSISYGNGLAAVSQADNCIKLLDGSNNIVRTIQNITQCYIPENEKDENISSFSLNGNSVFQAGLHVDSNTKSLVMNGKPGHLQSYSLREDKHLYNLDITQQNYVTAERKKVIPNANVTNVAFSAQGKWLSTVESLIDETKTLELRLKFWKFDTEKQLFSLNTSVNWPHEMGIVNLRIQPIDDKDHSIIAATSGRDKLFKTWSVVYDLSIHGKSDWWNCENIGSYRNQNTGPLAFSHDGSVLAVPFGNTLTLWKAQSHEVTGTLTHSKLKEEIQLVEFSAHPTPHLVICCTKTKLIIWDALTLSLLWTVPLEIESLAVDRMSNLVAAFSTKKHLYFFKPDIPQPIAIHKNISKSKVISSIFVPSFFRNEIKGLKSMLVFINSSQELCAMMSKETNNTPEEVVRRLKIEGGTSTLTPFAKLIAEKTVSNVRNSSNQSLRNAVIGIPGSHVIREIMDASPHTMPSVSYFCNQLLAAISVPIRESDHLEHFEKFAQGRRSLTTVSDSSDYEFNSDSEFSDDGVGIWALMKSNKKKKKTSKKSKSTAAPAPQPLPPASLSTTPAVKDIEVDLDLVSNDDTSWISAIFEPAAVKPI